MQAAEPHSGAVMFDTTENQKSAQAGAAETSREAANFRI